MLRADHLQQSPDGPHPAPMRLRRRPIMPGEKYYREWITIDGDDPHTNKLCERCFAGQEEMAPDFCYELEYIREDMRERSQTIGWKEMRRMLRERIAGIRKRFSRDPQVRDQV